MLLKMEALIIVVHLLLITFLIDLTTSSAWAKGWGRHSLTVFSCYHHEWLWMLHTRGGSNSSSNSSNNSSTNGGGRLLRPPVQSMAPIIVDEFEDMKDVDDSHGGSIHITTGKEQEPIMDEGFQVTSKIPSVTVNEQQLSIQLKRQPRPMSSCNGSTVGINVKKETRNERR